MNYYTDPKYGLNFIIPTVDDLGADDMAEFATKEIERRKDILFESWLAKNDDWNGEINEKKEELFIAKHRQGQEIRISFDPSQLGD